MRSSDSVIASLRDPAILAGLVSLLAMIMLSLTGLLLTPWDPNLIRGDPLSPPSLAHPLGTDDIGRDVAAMIYRGVLTSIFIGVSAAIVTTILGLVVGIIASIFRGFVDATMMRIVDFLLATPSLVLALILIAFLKPSIYNVILVLAITGWPGVARIVRAHSLQILSTGYVEAARALGASSWHIALRHLVPASIPVTLAAIVTTTRAAVLLEAGLGFLGLGDPSTISLGTILFYARRSAALASGAWWVIVPAGLLITIIVFALTMISIGMESRTLKRG
ncbi:MAG: ABC transporter permease [Sulfolobales archaeon]